MYSAVWRARRRGLAMTRSMLFRASPMAAAWLSPTSSSGGSSRPTSRPAALKPVRPWRTRISTPLVDHTPEGPLHECGIEVSRPPEQPPAAGIGQPEAVPPPGEDDEADDLEHHADHTPVDRRQRLVAGRGPAERPPEHLGVAPRPVEDEMQEHADRQGQPAPSPRPVADGGQHDDDQRGDAAGD